MDGVPCQGHTVSQEKLYLGILTLRPLLFLISENTPCAKTSLHWSIFRRYDSDQLAYIKMDL